MEYGTLCFNVSSLYFYAHPDSNLVLILGLISFPISRHQSLPISIFPYNYFYCTDVGLIHDDSLLNSYPSVALAIRSRACLNASNTFCTVL